MTAPIGILIGQAQINTRALLDRILTRTGTAFPEWVVLKLTADAGGTLPESDVREQLLRGIRVPADGVVTALVDGGLLRREGAAVALTGAGRARFAEIDAANKAQSAQLYAGLPADDLAVAARVLTEVAARARAELAA